MKFSKMILTTKSNLSVGQLIESATKTAYVYRSNQPIEALENSKTISGQPFLRGFKLKSKEIW
jgi:hypothetical protein